MHIILMGVSGSGKSTVGKAVAQRVDLPFFEGDDFHTVDNIERMTAGVALTDDDRVPWIAALARAVNGSGAKNAIVACSALTERVRRELASQMQQPLLFVHLTGNSDVIRDRLARRPQHFMKSGMLDSQLAGLELHPDALCIDNNRPLADVVQEVQELVRVQLVRSTK
jgi:carbohydrate kinase (thermoresistant glucokinase family)